MLLRPQHFAALRINWDDKVQNLRTIAAELNIGTDALAFMDDSPVERARVRAELPEVTVIDVPDDPMAYAQTLREQPGLRAAWAVGRGSGTGEILCRTTAAG